MILIFNYYRKKNYVFIAFHLSFGRIYGDVDAATNMFDSDINARMRKLQQLVRFAITLFKIRISGILHSRIINVFVSNVAKSFEQSIRK